MIDENLQEKQAQRNRINLLNETNERLDRWVEQINANLKGVLVKRSDLVNWLVTSHKEDLNSKELKLITKKYFSENAFTIWALKTAKEAQSRGAPTALSELMKMRPDGAPSAEEQPQNHVSKIRKKVKPSSENAPKVDASSSEISSKS